MTTKNHRAVELQEAIEWIKIAMQQIQRPVTWNHEAESKHMQALITAATSSSSRSEVPEWLPIESAPRDGSTFLCWHPDYSHGAGVTYYSEEHGVFLVGNRPQPTDWQPLPQPPKSTAQAERDQ